MSVLLFYWMIMIDALTCEQYIHAASAVYIWQIQWILSQTLKHPAWLSVARFGIPHNLQKLFSRGPATLCGEFSGACSAMSDFYNISRPAWIRGWMYSYRRAVLTMTEWSE